MENKHENYCIVCRGYIGIMEKKMETTIANWYSVEGLGLDSE